MTPPAGRSPPSPRGAGHDSPDGAEKRDGRPGAPQDTRAPGGRRMARSSSSSSTKPAGREGGGGGGADGPRRRDAAPAPPRQPQPRPATHFLCLPLAGPALARSWASFRADVTGGDGDGSDAAAEVPAGAVRPLGTLHLTLAMLSLTSPAAVARAIRVLEGLPARALLAKATATASASRTTTTTTTTAAAAANTTATTMTTTTRRRGGAPRPQPSPPPPPPAVTLRGLQTMQAPARATVLYAAPDDARGRLRRACERLRAPFCAAGLVADGPNRPLLLHATLVNTVYVRGRPRLDAAALLRRYAGRLWADRLPLASLAICKMGARHVAGGDAAYEVVAELRL